MKVITLISGGDIGGAKTHVLSLLHVIVLFHNRCANSVHNGICTLHLFASDTVYIDFKVSHEPGKIRVYRQFTQEGIIHQTTFQ